MNSRSRFMVAAMSLAAILLGAGRVAMPAQVKDRVIRSITLEAPAKGANKDSWDPALSVLAGNLRNLYPDVRICVESPHVPGRCLQTCENAVWPEGAAGHFCQASTGPNGILLESTLYVLADDIDDVGGNERIAMFKIIDPQKCREAPCTLELPGGTLRVKLDIVEVTTYGGPYRGVVGTFTPELPVAEPPGGSAPSPSPPGTLREILEALLPGLRDADSCTGPDRGVFDDLPSGTRMFRSRLEDLMGSSKETDRIYQMALLANAFEDPAARQQVINAIRSRGVDTDGPLWALAVGDLRYSRQLDDLAHRGVQFIADMALKYGTGAAAGRLLPGLSRNELVQEIEKSMIAKLGSEGAKGFMDRMFTHPSLSAECALNELAKQGLGDVIQNPPR